MKNLVSFISTRKRFTDTGMVSVLADYLPENLKDLRGILKNIPYGDNLDIFFVDYGFRLSEPIIDEECTDYSKSNNGGDYWKTHREIVIYEDDYIIIFINYNYNTSYDGGCCIFCGTYGSSCCEEPSIRAIRK